MTAVVTPGASFSGADVDGLDRLSSEFSQAATVCDEVRAACEAIVAASFVFGPFGAAFVAYLKGTVIPWLTKISEALQAMAKVLSAHAQAQRTASSPASLGSPGSSPGSLPTYATPTGLPAASTAEAPEPANGPADKPLTPGTLESSRASTYVMDKDVLGELLGKESPFHPTVPLQKGETGFALLDQKGEHVDLALDQGKVGEATWFGVDAKGSPQVGGAVEGSFNAVDLKLHTAVPLGGGSTLGLQNETTIGMHGSLSAQASYNPATGSGSAGLGAEGFVGAQNTTTGELRTAWFTDRVDGTVQYGVGGAAIGKVEFAPGHVTLKLAAGLADGPGAKIANSLDVNYGRIVGDAEAALGLAPRTTK